MASKMIATIGQTLKNEKSEMNEEIDKTYSIKMDPCAAAYDHSKEFEIPETIWIVPLIIVNSFRDGQDATEKKRTIVFVIGQGFLFCINFVLQCCLIYFVIKLTEEQGAANKIKQPGADSAATTYNPTSDFCPVDGANKFLMWVAETVSLTFMLGIILEGWNLVMYILYTKHNPDAAKFTVKKKPDHDKTYVETGMTVGQKIASILLVPIPMIVFALLLGFWGARFLLVSESNSDMILNMVALMFITEIGEGIWKSLVPSAFKKIRDAYPKTEFKSASSGNFSLSFKSAILFTVIAVGATLFLLFGCDKNSASSS